MINVVALCAGVGGLELGIKLAFGAATRVVCYVEREAYAAAVLAARMEDGALDQAPIWSDLATFDGRPWRGAVDMVTAGYPCQPFSTAGKRLGAADPRHLWPHVARVVDELQPAIVFCENVGAHLRNGFDVVARDMEGMGYSVAATLHTAAEHGAWHKRERLFWLASRNADGEGEHAVAVDAKVEGQSSSAAAANADSTQPAIDGETRSAADPDGAGLERQRPECELGSGAGARSLTPRYRGWESEPAVGRVADGVARRVDRLRACGNGVVPQVAANAFLELARALTCPSRNKVT